MSADIALSFIGFIELGGDWPTVPLLAWRGLFVGHALGFAFSLRRWEVS